MVEGSLWVLSAWITNVLRILKCHKQLLSCFLHGLPGVFAAFTLLCPIRHTKEGELHIIVNIGLGSPFAFSNTSISLKEDVWGKIHCQGKWDSEPLFEDCQHQSGLNSAAQHCESKYQSGKRPSLSNAYRAKVRFWSSCSKTALASIWIPLANNGITAITPATWVQPWQSQTLHMCLCTHRYQPSGSATQHGRIPNLHKIIF